MPSILIFAGGGVAAELVEEVQHDDNPIPGFCACSADKPGFDHNSSSGMIWMATPTIYQKLRFRLARNSQLTSCPSLGRDSKNSSLKGRGPFRFNEFMKPGASDDQLFQ